VCVTHYQVLNQCVEFNKILYRGHSTEGNFDAIIFNPVASTIPNWQTFRLLRLMQNLHQLTCDHKILVTNEQLSVKLHLEKKKIRTWRAVECYKKHSFFMETTHERLQLLLDKVRYSETSWTYRLCL